MENTEKNNLSCEVVQDLLPSYLDHLTSDVTNKAVEQHLEDCETCTEKMEQMQAAEEKLEKVAEEEAETETLEKKEIDFLKTLKKKTKKKIVLSVAGILSVVVLGVCLKLFVIGSELSPQEVAYDFRVNLHGEVTISNLSVLSSAKVISSISYKEIEPGVLRISLNGVLASPLPVQQPLERTYQGGDDLWRIYIGNQIIWDHDKEIEPRISALYQARHEFVGDMSKNMESVQALGMKEVLGDFENELQTGTEPYGWKIVLKSNVQMSDRKEMETKMKGYAALLLATIDNLEYVTYDYKIETYISGIEEKTLTITCEDVAELYNLYFSHPVFHEDGSYEIVEEPFKEHEWTPADLQFLLQEANLSNWRW